MWDSVHGFSEPLWNKWTRSNVFITLRYVLTTGRSPNGKATLSPILLRRMPPYPAIGCQAGKFTLVHINYLNFILINNPLQSFEHASLGLGLVGFSWGGGGRTKWAILFTLDQESKLRMDLLFIIILNHKNIYRKFFLQNATKLFQKLLDIIWNEVPPEKKINPSNSFIFWNYKKKVVKFAIFSKQPVFILLPLRSLQDLLFVTMLNSLSRGLASLKALWAVLWTLCAFLSN